MTLAPIELSSPEARLGLRRAFSATLEDALDALVEAQEVLSVAYSANSVVVREGADNFHQRNALELAQMELRLACAVVVDARQRCVEFEKQAAPYESAPQQQEGV